VVAITILASLAAVIFLALWVPLDIEPRLEFYGKPSFRLRLVWLFGLLSKEIGKGKKKKKKPDKPKERKKTAGAIFKVLCTKGLLRQLKVLLGDVLASLKVRELTLDFRVGFDDPADTGLLFAFIAPATPFFNSSTHRIRLEPSFEDRAVFEGYLHGVVRLRPIQLALPFIRFAFSLPAIRAIKILVLTKWKRKR